MLRKLIFCFLILVNTAVHAFIENNVLHVGVNYFQPPFIMRSGNNAYQGFDVSMMLYICKSLNRTCKFHSMPFGELLSSVQNGKIDAAVSSITITYERAQKVNFSNAYLPSQSRFLGSVDLKGQPITVDLLSSKKIGIKEGSIFDKQLRSFNLKQLDLHKFADDGQLIDALNKKDIDLGLTDNETAIYWQNQSSNKIVALGKPIKYGLGYGIATNLNDMELNKQINIALDNYHKDIQFKNDFDTYIKEF